MGLQLYLGRIGLDQHIRRIQNTTAFALNIRSCVYLQKESLIIDEWCSHEGGVDLDVLVMSAIVVDLQVLPDYLRGIGEC